MAQATREQDFVRAATNQFDDLPTYDPRTSYPAAWLGAVTARPFNFVPQAALDTILTAPDSHEAFVRVMVETHTRAVNFADEHGIPIPDTARHSEGIVAVAAFFQTRIVSGHLGEVAASEYLNGNVMETRDAARHLGLDDSGSLQTVANRVENAGVDLIGNDGTTYQVKAMEDVSDVETDADYILRFHENEITKFRA